MEDSGVVLLEALLAVIAQAAEPTKVLEVILDQAIARSAADKGLLVEVLSNDEFKFRVRHNFDPRHLGASAIQFSKSVCRESLKKGSGVLVANALTDPRFMGEDSVVEHCLASVLCLPIQCAGRIAALIYLEKSTPAHFRQGDQYRFEPLLAAAGAALETLRVNGDLVRERNRLRAREQSYREQIREGRGLLAHDWQFGRFVGRSEAVRRLEEQVQKAARSSSPVLLTGETGTGKTTISKILHFAGPRKSAAFVTVFCPSLEKGLVESELFGHKRGAFTDASADRVGKVQTAEKGTLFLDEVGDLPPEIQPRLLRLLHDKTYEIVGDPRERIADVRIVAATNRDLLQEVDERHFRRDLYERLNYLAIHIPPLRERKEDVPDLLRHALDNTEGGRWIELDAEARAYLAELDFNWPGNVRNVEQLAATIAPEHPQGVLTREDLEGYLEEMKPSSQRSGGHVAASQTSGTLSEAAFSAEKERVAKAVTDHPTLSALQIADELGVSRATFFKLLKRHGIRLGRRPGSEADH